MGSLAFDIARAVASWSRFGIAHRRWQPGYGASREEEERDSSGSELPGLCWRSYSSGDKRELYSAPSHRKGSEIVQWGGDVLVSLTMTSRDLRKSASEACAIECS